MTAVNDLAIIFGQSPTSQLILYAESKQAAPSTTNSIRVQIEARAGNFSGSCKARFSTLMFNELQRALQNFSNQPYGEFTLSSETQELWASLTGDGSGRFTVHCTLNDCDHKYTRFRFQVNFTSGEIPEIVASLQNILANQPS